MDQNTTFEEIGHSNNFLTTEIFEIYLENMASEQVPSFATLVDVVESALFQQNIKYSFNS